MSRSTARHARLALLLLAVAAALSPVSARAEQFLTVNPGVTFSYTFGRGITYGFELSLVWLPTTLADFRQRPFGVGVALDFDTNFADLFKVRVGGEVVGPFIGLEVGPTLVLDRTGAHLGIGITPWAGWQVMPYYTYTLVFGQAENLHQVGTYLKLYLDPNGSSASSNSDWD
jgi:hypothetical protein